LRLPLDATLWNEQRLARRAGGQDLGRWLEGVRTQLDSQLFGEAVRQLQEISLAFPKAVDVRLLLAEVHEGQGEYELALRAVQRALILEPDNAEGIALREEIERTLAVQRKRQ
jgi:tetratricopeptide (TPR) repeat protein